MTTEDPVSRLFSEALSTLRAADVALAELKAELAALRADIAAQGAKVDRAREADLVAAAAIEARSELLRDIRAALLSKWAPILLSLLTGGIGSQLLLKLLEGSHVGP